MPRLYKHHSLCDTHLLPSDVALDAPSLGAPAEAVFCVPIYEGSPDSLAMEHLSDVGTRFTGAMSVSSFRVEPCVVLYPSRYKTAFASSDLSLPSLHGPALRSACHASRMAD